MSFDIQKWKGWQNMFEKTNHFLTIVHPSTIGMNARSVIGFKESTCFELFSLLLILRFIG